MEDQLKNRPIETIEEEIKYLEDAYAECLKDEMDIYTLNRIWSRIKALKAEMEKRKE